MSRAATTRRARRFRLGALLLAVASYALEAIKRSTIA
jgi:hypothetical protein